MNLFLGTTENLISKISNSIMTSPELFHPLENILRFTCFLILVLHDLEELNMNDDVVAIIERYVEVLKGVHNGGELISYFLRILPRESQNIIYTNFLKDVQKDKMKYFQLGYDDELDMNVIVVQTVESIFQLGGLHELPLDEHFKISSIFHPILESDMIQISALDWFGFDPEQFYNQMVYTNYLIRLLLQRGRLNSVRLILERFPYENQADDEHSTKSDLTIVLIERFQYDQLVTYFVSYAEWLVLRNENKMSDICRKSTEDLIDIFDNILDGSIFGRSFEGDGNEFLTMRKNYIPVLFEMHYEVLISTHETMPRFLLFYASNIDAIFGLAVVIADPDSKMKDAFIDSHRLGEFLGIISQTVLMKLKQGFNTLPWLGKNI
jgi:hypothetical protein